MITVRKVRRICDVKGCANKNCYSISQSAEAGYSVIICPDCLKTAYEQIFPKRKAVKKNDE